MPKRKGRLPADKQLGNDLLYREISVADIGAADEQQRSLPIVLATETPIPTFDEQRMEVVPEVLRMDGIELPQQIPLVDSHNRESVRNVIGSIRDLRVQRGQLLGTAFFSASEDGQNAFRNYQDGHLTDFSVGAQRQQVEFRDGVKYVTRARLIEGSALVAGADPNAKVQGPLALRAYLDPHSVLKEKTVERLHDMLVQRGMPEETSGNDVFDWMERHLEELAKQPDDDQQPSLDEIRRTLGEVRASNATTQTVSGDKNVEINGNGEGTTLNRSIDDELKRERERITAITDLCRSHQVEDKVVRSYIEDGKTPDQVASDILKRHADNGLPLGPSSRIEHGASELDKFYSAASDGLMQRAIAGAGLKPSQIVERAKESSDPDSIQRANDLLQRWEKPAPGARDFRYCSLYDLAAECLERSGVKLTGRPPRHVLVRKALQMDMMQRADGPGYHVTGSFPQLLLDAANKTLLAGYDEAMVTYPMWVRQAPSASDFKTLNRVRMGELPDPEIVPENHPYKDMQVSDEKESYNVEKRGQLFSISMEAIVNDDLDAISRIPAMQGTAMRRKINKDVYSILTGNPNLSDGNSLFDNSNHGNADTNALAAGALDTLYTSMQTQAGLQSGTILNIQPMFLIVPAALASTALQILQSVTPPDVGGDTTGTSGTANLYGPNGPRRLTPVIEGQLDGNSTTAWYAAASPSQIDTIEITFLQGEESPVLDREDGFEIDAVRYKIRQTYAAKAIDYRGLYRGNT